MAYGRRTMSEHLIAICGVLAHPRVMKKIIAVAVAILGTASVASAADLAVKARPYIAPAPVFTWTGCYVGVHAGAGVLHDQGFQAGGGMQVIELPPENLLADRHGVGGLAGGQIGCNYQTGMLVLGIEGEGFWSGMKVTQDAFDGNFLFGSARIRNKWDYDVAGRIGVAFDRALVYGKAGWVAGGFDWNFATTDGVFTNQGSATLDGLLIGVGLEYAFLNNWTVKFEYDYLGFGAKNVAFSAFCGVCTNPSATFTQNVSADKHIFKVGLNYLFNFGGPAVVAKY
jgi:outer membrane immunogenic protein